MISIKNNKVVKWFRKLLRIVNQYDIDKDKIYSKIDHSLLVANNAEKVIRERTDINLGVSINSKEPSQIIIIGRYKGTDYIEAFSLLDENVSGMIDRLREMQRYAVVRRIDAPLEMKGVIKHGLWEWE